MLDMSLMRGVWVDPATRTARAQVGCLLGDVDRETQIHGLATVLGFVSDTGVAGLTLGGGFGYLTRSYGWACDNLLSVDVVTADGRALRASEGEHRDLFWGLRGGGGNLGIATSLEYRLHPVGPQVMAGAIAWPAEHVREVLAMYADLTARAPRELTCLALLLTAPPVPWLSQEVHGAPVVMLAVCYTGTVEEGERHVAAIKAFGEPVGDIIGPRPYAAQQRLFDASQPPGRRYYLKSEYLHDLPPDLLGRLVDHAQRVTSPYSTTFLFHLAGAIRGLADDYSAVGNRDAAYVLMFMGSWEDPAADEVNIQWARVAWEETRQYSTGGTYVNFLSEDEGAERIRSAYASNYERLATLKATWDPDNLFRMNKNVAPRVAG
jgi:FAD/FMN-containing dehydrogenase